MDLTCSRVEELGDANLWCPIHDKNIHLEPKCPAEKSICGTTQDSCELYVLNYNDEPAHLYKMEKIYIGEEEGIENERLHLFQELLDPIALSADSLVPIIGPKDGYKFIDIQDPLANIYHLTLDIFVQTDKLVKESDNCDSSKIYEKLCKGNERTILREIELPPLMLCINRIFGTFEYDLSFLTLEKVLVPGDLNQVGLFDVNLTQRLHLLYRIKPVEIGKNSIMRCEKLCKITWNKVYPLGQGENAHLKSTLFLNPPLISLYVNVSDSELHPALASGHRDDLCDAKRGTKIFPFSKDFNFEIECLFAPELHHHPSRTDGGNGKNIKATRRYILPFKLGKYSIKNPFVNGQAGPFSVGAFYQSLTTRIGFDSRPAQMPAPVLDIFAFAKQRCENNIEKIVAKKNGNSKYGSVEFTRYSLKVQFVKSNLGPYYINDALCNLGKMVCNIEDGVFKNAGSRDILAAISPSVNCFPQGVSFLSHCLIYVDNIWHDMVSPGSDCIKSLIEKTNFCPMLSTFFSEIRVQPLYGTKIEMIQDLVWEIMENLPGLKSVNVSQNFAILPHYPSRDTVQDVLKDENFQFLSMYLYLLYHISLIFHHLHESSYLSAYWAITNLLNTTRASISCVENQPSNGLSISQAYYENGFILPYDNDNYQQSLFMSWLRTCEICFSSSGKMVDRDVAEIVIATIKDLRARLLKLIYLVPIGGGEIDDDKSSIVERIYAYGNSEKVDDHFNLPKHPKIELVTQIILQNLCSPNIEFQSATKLALGHATKRQKTITTAHTKDVMIMLRNLDPYDFTYANILAKELRCLLKSKFCIDSCTLQLPDQGAELIPDQIDTYITMLEELIKKDHCSLILVCSPAIHQNLIGSSKYWHFVEMYFGVVIGYDQNPRDILRCGVSGTLRDLKGLYKCLGDCYGWLPSEMNIDEIFIEGYTGGPPESSVYIISQNMVEDPALVKRLEISSANQTVLLTRFYQDAPLCLNSEPKSKNLRYFADIIINPYTCIVRVKLSDLDNFNYPIDFSPLIFKYKYVYVILEYPADEYCLKGSKPILLAQMYMLSIVVKNAVADQLSNLFQRETSLDTVLVKDLVKTSVKFIHAIDKEDVASWVKRIENLHLRLNFRQEISKEQSIEVLENLDEKTRSPETLYSTDQASQIRQPIVFNYVQDVGEIFLRSFPSLNSMLSQILLSANSVKDLCETDYVSWFAKCDGGGLSNVQYRTTTLFPKLNPIQFNAKSLICFYLSLNHSSCVYTLNSTLLSNHLDATINFDEDLYNCSVGNDTLLNFNQTVDFPAKNEHGHDMDELLIYKNNDVRCFTRL